MSNLFYINKTVERNYKMLDFRNIKTSEERRNARMEFDKEYLIKIIEDLENEYHDAINKIMILESKLDSIEEILGSI